MWYKCGLTLVDLFGAPDSEVHCNPASETARPDGDFEFRVFRSLNYLLYAIAKRQTKLKQTN